MQSDSRTHVAGLLTRLFDYCCIAAAFGLAGVVASRLQQFGIFVWPDRSTDDIAGWPLPYAALLFASLLLWGVTSNCLHIYKWGNDVLMPRSLRQLFRAITLWLGVIAAAIFLLKLSGLSRQFTLLFLTVAALALVLKCLVENHTLIRLV
ncbi:MAG: hypothetical protein ACRETL_15080, partial [Gammaproteobacteria bacterium]